MRAWRLIATVAVVGFGLAVSVAWPQDDDAAGSDAALIDYVVATVDGEAITWTALRDETELRGLRVDSALDRRQTMHLLVDELLFVREARNFVIIADGAVDEAMRAAPVHPDTDEGVSAEARRERVRRQLMLAQFAERAFGPRVSRATDADVESHYEAHLDDYRVPAQYRLGSVRHHVAPGSSPAQDAHARATLDALRDQLDAGSVSLAELAGRASEDALLSVDADADWVAESALSAAVADAAGRLAVGEWSDSLRVGAGHAIVQVDEVAAAWTQELGPELADVIARSLRAEGLQALMQTWLEERRLSADIRILDPDLLVPTEGDLEEVTYTEGK
ncbi:peptidyl-prolyl cis-trans isomerase [Candidatus Poribacteria bacterium]|jgi:hypothetical protein|nr:peptidyl-prolyl cis-trans isomerase [Candidatus Poribacteria bacterium]MBT5532290.1 peptidyl-prolyl cis-trans isomerase [Candidatus Poribacteria bacterium]MBT7099799.1 peptidyl-prolyl cis-trans isomerase [Candidatus Poribacteria bacterium]